MSRIQYDFLIDFTLLLRLFHRELGSEQRSGIMKFGLLLEQAMRAEWAANYVNYKVNV
jgi:hypothetical protein